MRPLATGDTSSAARIVAARSPDSAAARRRASRSRRRGTSAARALPEPRASPAPPRPSTAPGGPPSRPTPPRAGAAGAGASTRRSPRTSGAAGAAPSSAAPSRAPRPRGPSWAASRATAPQKLAVPSPGPTTPASRGPSRARIRGPASSESCPAAGAVSSRAPRRWPTPNSSRSWGSSAKDTAPRPRSSRACHLSRHSRSTASTSPAWTATAILVLAPRAAPAELDANHQKKRERGVFVLTVFCMMGSGRGAWLTRERPYPPKYSTITIHV